jgi:hypothetical protein
MFSIPLGNGPDILLLCKLITVSKELFVMDTGNVPEMWFEPRSISLNDFKRLNVELGSVPLRPHPLHIITSTCPSAEHLTQAPLEA